MSTTPPCPEWRELLAAYQDTQLSDGQTRRVDEHLTGCAACRGWLAALDMDRARFTAAYAESSGGPQLRAAVLEELRMKTHKQKTPLSPLALRRLFATGGAVALLVIIAAFAIVGSPFARRSEMAQSEPPAPLMSATMESDGDESPEIAGMRQPAPQSSAMRRAQPPALPPSSTTNAPLVDYAADSVGIKDDAKSKNSLDGAWMAASRVKATDKSFDADIPQQNDGAMTFSELERNYGIPGGLKMAFTVSYSMEVKQALQSARKAQEIIKKHGGFSMDFQYEAPKGEKPWATFHGKIPAKEAAGVLDDIEKLGMMRSVDIGAEDITDQYRNLEEQFKKSKGDTKAYYQKELEKLALKHNLVDFSATFIELKPREPFTFETLVQRTIEILRYILLALITLGVALVLITFLILPFEVVRYLRRRDRLPATQKETTTEETE